MRCGIQKILIWLLSFSLVLPSFSVSVYANEIPQEMEMTSLLEENEDSQLEIIEEELEVGEKQPEVNGEQSEIVEEQPIVDKEQPIVNEEQSEIVEEQPEISEEEAKAETDGCEEELEKETEEDLTPEEETKEVEAENQVTSEEEQGEVEKENQETSEEEQEKVEDELEEIEEQEDKEETEKYNNTAEDEEEIIEELQYIEVDLSDKILHTGGLLDEESTFTNSEVSFFATEEEILNNEISAVLLSAFISCESELDITEYKITPEQFSDIYSAVLNRNPRFFYVKSFFAYYQDSQGYISKLYLYYRYDKNTSMEMLAEFDKAINAATSKVSANWSDMEKALYINDYLARNCEYDLTYSKYSAYDALVNKTAVCQGYSEAFLTLAREVGLQCEIVTSWSLNHAWNMVLINDEFYNIDVTWNDPTSDLLGRARHYYFLKSTSHYKSAEAGHFIEDDWTVTGGWKANYASDTSYDTYFWNDIDCGFDYLNGYWYGFDGVDKIVKYSCNGSSFDQVEAIIDITDRWFLLNPSIYSHAKHVGTGSYGDMFYYSTDDSIYAINIKDNTLSKIFQLSDSQISSDGYIFNMNINPLGDIYYYQTPDLFTQGIVKKAMELSGNVTIYHIAFDKNGATAGEMKNLTDRIYGTTYQLPRNEFVRTGYSFSGWNTKADGSGKGYADQSDVKNLTSSNGKTITLYAQWKKAKYKISYNLNGGKNNSGNPTGFYADSNTITLKNPTRTGYTFKGWYSDSSFKEKVTEITKGSIGDRTLYAKWIVNKYNIAFNGNKNTSGSMSTLSNCKYGSSYTLTANAFKKKGYSFIGWNTKADGSGTTYKNKAGVKNLTSTNGKTITLYAQWKKANYSITYNLNGGKNNSKNPATYTITTADIKLQNPTRTGYTFKGWYSDSKFTQKVTTITKGSTGNKTLYAKWSVNKYNIAFNGNKNTSGSMKTLSNCKYGSSYTLTANAFKKKGYSFTGWNTKADGTGTTYKNKASVKNLSSTNGKTITLYAQWKKATYSIAYNLNGGKNNSKNPATYTITTADIKLQNPTRTGYTFKGWYSDSEFTKKVTSIPKGSTGTKTLYAKWTVNKYNIAFNGNKNTSGSMKTLSNCKYGSSYTLTANAFKKKGYSFTGWNTKADGTGTTYKNKASVKNLSSSNGKTITLYAQWKKVNYSITYNLNGGKNNSKNPATYTITTADIKLKNPTRTGYTFKGWYSDSKFTKKVTAIAKGSTGNKTLYAKWTKK